MKSCVKIPFEQFNLLFAAASEATGYLGAGDGLGGKLIASRMKDSLEQILQSMEYENEASPLK